MFPEPSNYQIDLKIIKNDKKLQQEKNLTESRSKIDTEFSPLSSMKVFQTVKLYQSIKPKFIEIQAPPQPGLPKSHKTTNFGEKRFKMDSRASAAACLLEFRGSFGRNPTKSFKNLHDKIKVETKLGCQKPHKTQPLNIRDGYLREVQRQGTDQTGLTPILASETSISEEIINNKLFILPGVNQTLNL